MPSAAGMTAALPPMTLMRSKDIISWIHSCLVAMLRFQQDYLQGIFG